MLAPTLAPTRSLFRDAGCGSVWYLQLSTLTRSTRLVVMRSASTTYTTLVITDKQTVILPPAMDRQLTGRLQRRRRASGQEAEHVADEIAAKTPFAQLAETVRNHAALTYFVLGGALGSPALVDPVTRYDRDDARRPTEPRPGARYHSGAPVGDPAG